MTETTKSRKRRQARLPLPGARVRGSTTGRPLMALLDLIGRRWVLRLLWELRGGPRKFRELQQLCGDISPTIVNRRLADLKKARIVVSAEEGGYALTALGRKLLESLAPLNAWAKEWERALHTGRER